MNIEVFKFSLASIIIIIIVYSYFEIISIDVCYVFIIYFTPLVFVLQLVIHEAHSSLSFELTFSRSLLSIFTKFQRIEITIEFFKASP